MVDRNEHPIAVGNMVKFYIGKSSAKRPKGGAWATGVVRAIEGDTCRVDDGDPQDANIRSNGFSVSAWVTSGQVEFSAELPPQPKGLHAEVDKIGRALDAIGFLDHQADPAAAWPARAKVVAGLIRNQQVWMERGFALDAAQETLRRQAEAIRLAGLLVEDLLTRAHNSDPKPLVIELDSEFLGDLALLAQALKEAK